MSTPFADTFTQLNRSVWEFRQVRDATAAWGVSWVMADRQLELLVRANPARARQILDQIEGVPVAGQPPLLRSA